MYKKRDRCIVFAAGPVPFRKNRLCQIYFEAKVILPNPITSLAEIVAFR